MVDVFLGTWTQTDSDNFEEYMKEVKVGLVTRKAAAHLKMTAEFIKEPDGKLTIHLRSTFKNVSSTVELNKEIPAFVTPDGRTVRSIFYIDEQGKLVEKQSKIKDDTRDSIITREVRGDELFVELISGSVRATQKYKRA